jgi:enolase
MKHTKNNKLKYFTTGVGGDPQCHLQVVIDSVTFEAFGSSEDFSTHLPYNCVNIRLGSLSSVSHAIELCKKAKAFHCATIISSNDDASQPESGDTFIADFAVGVGAGQLMGGGMGAGQFAEKYNRVLAIQREREKIKYVGGKFR